MKRAILCLIAIVLATALHAQESKPKEESKPTYNTTRELRSRVFTIHHRDPRVIVRSIQLLGSGFQGTGVDVNDELGTITVRDFPENLATIEEAIKRLDVPTPPEAEIVFHLFVLMGSSGANGARELPAELADVVPQLQSTLRYSTYGLMTSAVHRTRSGDGIEGSGVADSKLIGTVMPDGKPVFYNYQLRRVTLGGSGEDASIDVQRFEFSMHVPIAVGDTVQYRSVGFNTPVTIRQGETIVVGTTTMGDKALIVVVTTEVIHPGQ